MQPIPVKVISRDSFQIVLPASDTKYTRGGYYREVKQPFTARFKSFAAGLAAPELIPNLTDFERPAQLHALTRALWSFAAEVGRLPEPHNMAEAAAVLARAQTLLDGACVTVDALCCVASSPAPSCLLL
jgi:hypothetical protein